MEKKDEKLAQGQVAPYLGHKLRFGAPGFPYLEFELVGINEKCLVSDEGRVYALDSVFKPLLHPIDRIVKPITHKGKNFIPAKILFPVSAEEEDNYAVFGEMPQYWTEALKTPYKYHDYWMIEKMAEWHIDFQGLIPKGLAWTKPIQP